MGRTSARVSEMDERNVFEAILATQLVATHEAAMACFRWAARAEQTCAGSELV